MIEQLVVLSTNEIIQTSDLPQQFQKLTSLDTIDSANLSEARSKLVTNFEKQFISNALNNNSWNISLTAKTIGVSREGLHRMIKKYRLSKSD